jgi:hypothetical protein
MLADLIADLIGGFLGNELTERRSRRKADAKLSAFNNGRRIEIRCALRYPAADHANWQHGTLALSRGRAAWRKRFKTKPSLTLNRHTAVGVRARRITGREAFRVSTSLLYDVDGVSVEKPYARTIFRWSAECSTCHRPASSKSVAGIAGHTLEFPDA